MAKKKKCPPAGSPAWMATFADLMSLLMCFFVLLLSFAQMDQVKFKEVSGSMRNAFGEDLLSKIPASMLKKAMKDFENEAEEQTKNDADKKRPEVPPVKADLDALKEQLQDELRAGIITVEDGGGKIAVRIEQVQAFPSGSADLLDSIEPTLAKISQVLSESDAHVRVDGHTDNVPISTARFRSNWELSAARAATVVNSLLGASEIDSARMEIRGHADTKPLFENDTPEHRARNRRIEIVLDYDRKPTNEGGSEAATEAESEQSEGAAQETESAELTTEASSAS